MNDFCEAAPYSSKAVANCLLDLAKAKNVGDMSNLKLQKLVYYAHAWHLAYFGKPLIREEVQAWRFGPVIVDIYHEFKSEGNEPITFKAKKICVDENGMSLIEPTVPIEDKQVHDLLNEVFRIYGHLTPIQLSQQSHSQGEPWKEISDQFKDELPHGIAIPDKVIETCFKKLAVN